MRIAILTQPLGHNYGGILQNYALQNILQILGHTPTTLKQKDLHQISFFKLLIELPKRLFTKYILKKRKYIFSEYVYNPNPIDLTQFDVYIVGSDQVWRPKYNIGMLDKMFLSFLSKRTNIKRISYAASFGTKEWEYTVEQTAKCSKFLSRFDAVSVRETDGVELCKEYLKREDAVCVLDPTLLLEREEYEELCREIPKIEEDILCAYILDLNDDIESKLKTIAIQKGLKLKIVSADNKCTLTVPEWLAMFRDAKMIITDSFHGTVFSIIFNKEFYSITNIDRGGSRFTSLLSQFDLMSRLHVSINEISLIDDTIKWDSVNAKRNELKQYSINFLTSNLS